MAYLVSAIWKVLNWGNDQNILIKVVTGKIWFAHQIK